MKIRNWLKKVPAALLAAGIWLPSALYGASIPVPDADFEGSTPVGGFQYVFDANAGGTTPWESKSGHTWLYDSAYSDADGLRPSPLSGDTAAHAYGSYMGQTLTATFEAGKEYTLTVQAAGDSDATAGSDETWLYFYNGTDSVGPQFDGSYLAYSSGFSSANGDFEIADGDPGTPDTWTSISYSYTATAADDGDLIGIAIYGRGDAAYEDVSLSYIPEPTSLFLVGLGIGLGGLIVPGRHKR